MPISLAQFVEEIGPVLTLENGDTSANAQDALSLPSLTLKVDAFTCTLDRGSVRPGCGSDGLVLEANADAASDLLNGVRSIYGLIFGGGGNVVKGELGDVLAWDHVLEALLDGRPLYRPGSLDFRSRDGSPLDLERSFHPDDDDADIANFIGQAGFCRLQRWVDPSELAAIAKDVQEAALTSNPGDPHRWWATLDDGSERCIRVMYLLESSPHMRELVDGRAYSRLGELFGDGHRIHRENPQASEALIKPVGTVHGLSEFPWHRDCSLGGHTYHCAGYAIGLPLTPTGGDYGYLRVVAGSHRVSMPSPGLVRNFEFDLPVLPLDTQPGDLTVHVGCTLHGTKPPRDKERVATYTTYSLPTETPGSKDVGGTATPLSG